MTQPDAATARNFDAARFRDLYRQMWRIRAFEEQALRGAKEGLVLGAIHPSIGQEAVAVGVCGRLNRDDILLSTHRGHGHTLIKGAAPEAMMRELFGRDGGNCGGKGGSMHIADAGVGMLGANGVVAANIPIAVGAAHAIRLRKESRIVCCIFGDGAINRGPFLEGLNWAKVFDLPVLFVCEDNRFAATTRTAAMTAGEGAAARAEALGIPADSVDGNDLVAVDELVDETLQEVRAGGGPRLIVARTYRLTGHTGADPATYRPESEVATAWEDDPIARLAATLEAAGVSQDDCAALARQAQEEMAGVFERASAAPWPPVGHAYTDVQDTGSPEERPW